MRHTKAIHLNVVDERQFEQLTQLANTDPDTIDNDQVTLIQGVVEVTDEPA
jgi:hypothetical protein